MGRIRVTQVIEAPRRRVWEDLRDIASHVEWMEDARAIRFRSRSRTGVGTTYECDTKVGPLQLTDVMEIVTWKPRREMTIRHAGLVTGEGRWLLRRAGRGRTKFVWQERLRFPWWLGGPAGELAAGVVLRRIWKRNLGRLKTRIEAGR